MGRRSLIPVLITTIALTPALAPAEVERREANNGNVVLEAVPEVPEALRNQLNRYLEVRSAPFSDWSEDGASVYVTTRFGNVSQLHHVASPGAARRQLTFFEEPVSGVERRPGGSDLTFRMDEGGSEFSQIFLFDPKTGNATRLTDGTSRNGAVAWSRDGSRIAYQSTRRDGKANDVWIMSPDDPESARLAFAAPDGSWYGASDWSRDGKQIVVMQYTSVTDSRIHLLEVESGKARQIAGDASNPASFLGINPVFDAGEKGIFLSTNVAGDFSQLAHLELATSELTFITTDIQWDVNEFALSPGRDRGAFIVNEAGVDRLFLFDPATRAYARVSNVPIGLVGGLEFSASGDRLGMTLNAAKTPSDTFTLALGESALEYGELTRWTHSEVGGLDTESFSEPELIEYPTFDRKGDAPRKIPAFVYRPRGDGPFPVVISIHGGPEGQYRPSFSSTYQSWVAELGVAVVAPNVRGSAGYGREYVTLDNGFLREDSVKDIGALLDWIETQPDLDSSRVAVYGGSYGGYMVLASLVHYGDRLEAGIDIVGISNFVTFLENTQDYRRDLRRVEYGDERDPKMRAFLERISPSSNADKITTPLFVAQGQNDPRVPVTESEQIVEAVRGAGYDVWYMNALNEGHGFRKKENADLYRQIAVLFLKRHLLGEAVVPAGEPSP